jgi:DNA polymerase III epsilon subunit-like protein
MTIIFFDTETTDDVTKGRLIQLGIKERGVEKPVLNAMYAPPMPISFESMAVHHITPKIIGDRPLFKDAAEYAKTKALFEAGDTIAVAHNASFDIAILKKEDIAVPKSICTMKVAKALDPEDKIPSYRLQYLRYFLGIEVEGINAHDAWGDVVVLEQLFERLLAKMVKDKGSEEAAINEMIAISQKPSLVRTIRFGKYVGKKLADILKEDRGYLEWLLKQKQQNPDGDEDMVYSLEEYLGIPHQAAKLWD